MSRPDHGDRELVATSGLDARQSLNIVIGMGERNANIGPKYAVRIGDLRPHHVLTAACLCGHRRQMRLWQLRAGQGPNTMLTSIEARLRCMRCGLRGFATVLVTVSEED